MQAPRNKYLPHYKPFLLKKLLSIVKNYKTTLHALCIICASYALKMQDFGQNRHRKKIHTKKSSWSILIIFGSYESENKEEHMRIKTF